MKYRSCLLVPFLPWFRRGGLYGLALLSAAFLTSTHSLNAGVAFPDPATGWTYLFDGDANDPGSGGFTALDGSWSHDNDSDEWDGTPIGEGSPGGVSALTENDVTFLRLQETGDPRDHDFSDPGSTRKIFLGHDISAEGASDNILDEGVTISFRARVPISAPLDDQHPGGGSIAPWPAEGLGYVQHNGGKSTFGVKQAAGGTISFALATTAETGTDEEGLIMNNLNGTSVTEDVDLGDGGDTNLLPLEPREWHEFWITIEPDDTGSGTHKATVFVDGEETPQEFIVTAGAGSDFDDISYITLGLGATPFQGAVDVDFMAYSPGVKRPGYPEIVNLTPARGTSFYDETGGLSFDVLAPGSATIPTDNIQLTLNGEDVSGDLEISGTDQERNVAYNQLEAGNLYRAEIIVSDQEGKETVLNFSFDTLDPADAFVIEAEDYNFGPDAVCNADGSVGGDSSTGGAFFNDPTPSAFVGGNPINQDPDGYVDRVGVPGIDMNDTQTSGGDQDANAYRFCDPVGTEETSDVLRQKYEDASAAAGATIPDYHVHQVQAGEWLNYTRNFEEGNYKLVLRAASGAGQTVQLSEVTSDPTQPDQTVQVLGDFNLAPGGFGHTALSAVDGSDLVVALSGETTLRLTAPDADDNLELNYLMLVPTEESPTVIGPVVDSAVPAPDSTDAPRNQIRIELVNRETALDASSVQLSVDGTDVTADAQVTETADGAVVEYVPDPEFEPGTEHSVTLTYSDTDANSFESSWSFTTSDDVTPPEVEFAWATVDSTATTLTVVFSEDLGEASATDLANYSLDDDSVSLDSAALWRGRMVNLTISDAVEDTVYTLTVTGVADAIGNALTEGTARFTLPLVQVNFQPDGSDVPDGYLQDTGLAFGDRGNGFSYGWEEQFDETRDRDSANAPDQRYDTLNHLQNQGVDHVWEIELANDRYDVFMVWGDPGFTDQVNTFDIEGLVIEDPDGGDNFDEHLVTVQVDDGRLTLQPAAGSSNSKLVFLHVAPSAQPETAPEITQQPEPQFVTAGSSATFEVGAFGAPPLTYEWQFNGTTIEGEDQSTLTIDSVALEDRGAYTAIVRNDLGEAVSQAAYLVVIEEDWTYTLQTDQLLVGEPDAFNSLDGTWGHDNGSDEWDGSPIGGTIGADNKPGGVSQLDGYVRIQETGDPRDHGFDPDPSNRKVYLGHDLTSQGGTATILDDGLTLRFRARIPTDGTLDELHPDGADATEAYPAEGDGYEIHDGGKGNIGVKQADGGIVSFSLITAAELNAAAGRDEAGLIMNNLNGTALSGDVNTGDPGDLNFLPLDPTQWHEFWITIQQDTTGTGTHQVDVYLDGSTTPQTFFVTAGDGSDFSGFSYLAVGTGSTGQSGALDIENLNFRPGVSAPDGGGPGPELSIGLTAEGEIQIEWTGTLQEADQVTGPFTDVPGATSPMTVPPDESQKYWRSQE